MAIPPSSKIFTLEDQMLPIVRNSFLKGAFSSCLQHVLVREKTPVGSVIPDLVLCIGSKKFKSQIPNHRNLSHLECAILAYILNQKETNIESVVQAIFAPEYRVAPALTKLISRRLVVIGKNGSLRGLHARIPKINIISVEAKLTRWNEALEQATEYLRFSNSTYVAMPRRILEQNSSIVAHCKSAGVGLIAVEQKQIVRLVKPKSILNRSSKWLWLADKLSGFSTKPIIP